MARRVLHHLDRWAVRLTSQRSTLSSLLSGLPVLMLTTTGARSGVARTVPLLGIPMGDELALIGSNYGQRPTPGWVHNLLAHPLATVAHGTVAVAARARLAEAEVAGRAIAVGAGLYAGFAKYPGRASHREIKVFLLESA